MEKKDDVINFSNKKKLRAYGKYIMIEKTEKELTTSTGIIISTEKGTEQDRGIVVSVGGEVEKLSNNIKQGDMVIFSKYSAIEVKFEGNDYIFIKENDIIGIISF